MFRRTSQKIDQQDSDKTLELPLIEDPTQVLTQSAIAASPTTDSTRVINLAEIKDAKTETLPQTQYSQQASKISATSTTSAQQVAQDLADQDDHAVTRLLSAAGSSARSDEAPITAEGAPQLAPVSSAQPKTQVMPAIPGAYLSQAAPLSTDSVYQDQKLYSSGENTGRLATFRPSNIRQTRPTAWAIFQHVLTALIFILLLCCTINFFVQTMLGQQLDESAFQEFAYQFLTYQENTDSILDWIPTMAAFVAGVAFLFVLMWKRRFIPALLGFVIALGINISAQVLKNDIISKPALGIQEALLNSSPSGHTSFAASAGAALFIASPKKLRPAVALFATVLTLLAGFSTIIDGWHRPSDVISAIFLASVWTVLGMIILRFLRSEELDMSDTQRSGFILIPLSTITCIFMGICALILYLVNFYSAFSGAILAASSCLIISAAAFVLSMTVSLLRPQNKQRKAYTKVWTY